MLVKKEKANQIKKLVFNGKTKNKHIVDGENAIVVIENDEGNCCIWYILDDENAIEISENDAQNTNNEYYTMAHKRLENGNIVEINKWNTSSYYFNSVHSANVIKNLNLFKVQNANGNIDALYDYKKGEFVIQPSVWGEIELGVENEILKKYNGFLTSFEIYSDYENGDIISYTNPMTSERVVKSFGVKDGIYYALINTDGTIRGNKLFKGDSFSRISQIIDLNQYESLDAFKQERRQFCNSKRETKKQEYQQMLKTRGDGSISPYLDSEVAKVLELKK